MAAEPGTSPPAAAYYRALYDYKPSEEDQANGFLVVSEGDLLEVACPFELEGGTVEHPTGWLYGKNRQTGLSGYFPSGEYVKYTVKPQAGRRPQTPAPTTTQSSIHRMNPVYFRKPVLCCCCKDFIWGTGDVGKVCEGCGIYVHNECESLISSYIGASCSSSCSRPTSAHCNDPIPIEDWDVANVIEWLAVVNLYRYTHIFRQHKISGKSLAVLDRAKLQSMQIIDEFHQQAILAAVDILCGHVGHTNGTCDDKTQPVCGTAKSRDHSLTEASFSSLQKCHVCSQLLLGVLRQGFQCLKCGLCCHRHCLVASLPRCDIEEMKKFNRLSFPSNLMFMSPLEAQFSVSPETPAPPLLIHCITFLEKAPLFHHRIKLLEEYRKSCPTGEIDKLKHSLCEAPEGDMAAIVSHSRPVCVAGLLKKYLRELPDSVIPQNSYNDFINAAKLSDDGECEATLCELVNNLPAAHQSTLQYLITHLRRVCWPSGRTQPVVGTGNSRDPAKLITEVFYEILLRPQWINVMDIVHNAEYHLRVVGTLLICRLWSEQQTPLTPPPTCSPRYAPLVSADELKPCRLEEAPWYWGGITKEEVSRMLCDMPDGTFLVRDAADRSPNSFTLTVRKGGTNRLVRVYHHDGFFGFSEPFQFSTVVELINYYRTHSLSEFNDDLDIVLARPISRFSASTSKPQPVSSLRHQYLAAHSKYVSSSEELFVVTEKHSQTMQAIQMKQQWLEAFRETLSIFTEQMKLCESSEKLAAPHELNQVRENLKVLRQRVQSIIQSRDNLQAELSEDLETSRKLLTDTNALKPEIKELGLKRDNFRKQLLEGGDSVTALDNLLKDHEHNLLIVESSEPLVPVQYFENESLWHVECDRHEAERLLAGKEEGTFLIRPKEPDEIFVLSIVKPNSGVDSIAHCLIHRINGFYGFAEPYYIHRTLMDLVLHYREESLFEHNDELDTKLSFPVRLTSQQLSSLRTVSIQPQNDSGQNYVMVDLKRQR